MNNLPHRCHWRETNDRIVCITCGAQSPLDDMPTCPDYVPSRITPRLFAAACLVALAVLAFIAARI